MSERPVCLLFGGNKLNRGVVDRFHEWGCDVVVIDWNESPALVGDRHLRLDVKDSASIVRSLKERDLLRRIQTGYTSIDVAVPSLAAVLKECGLLVNSDDGLRNCWSKSRQTDIWRRAGLLNRISKRYDAWDDDICDWNKGQPLIMKPDDAASSRGITILNRASSDEDVRRAYEKALAGSHDGAVVVEEFVTGTEFTVEMLGDAYGNVSVYAVSKKQHTKNADRNKIAVKLHYNAIDESFMRRIAEAGMACYRALGFRCSFGHLEVLVRSDGTVSPVEIGARSSGFIASDLVDIVSGRSFLRDLCDVQNGGRVPDGLRQQTDRSAMLFFYDLPSGAVVRRRVSLLDFCDKSIASHYSDLSGIVVGKRIENIDSDNTRLGYEVLEGPKTTLTESAIHYAERRMLAETFRE